MRLIKQITALLLVVLFAVSASSCTFEETYFAEVFNYVRYDQVDKDIRAHPTPACQLVDPKNLESYEKLQTQANTLEQSGTVMLSDEEHPWFKNYLAHISPEPINPLTPQSVGSEELFHYVCLTYAIINDYFESFSECAEENREAHTEQFLGTLSFLEAHCNEAFHKENWIIRFLKASVQDYLLKNYKEYHAYHEVFRQMLDASHPASIDDYVDNPEMAERWKKIKKCRAYYLETKDAKKSLEMLSEFYDWEGALSKGSTS